MNSLAATLREAEPGIKIRLLYEDGREVSGVFRGVSGDAVDLENGAGRVDLTQVKRVDLTQVKRVLIEYSPGLPKAA
jgi:hypothetical protein